MKCKACLRAGDVDTGCQNEASLIAGGEMPVCVGCASELLSDGIKLDTIPSAFTKKFLRNTHIENREGTWFARPELPKNLDLILKSHNIGIFHFLDPKKPLSFEEMYQEIQKYIKDNGGTAISKEQVGLELLRCVELDIVKVVG